MNRKSQTLALVMAFALALLPSACRTQDQVAAPGKPVTTDLGLGMDPCTDRLGGLCEQLMLYYAAHKELPERLADLGKAGADPPVPVICPKSGKPYVYNRAGLPVTSRSGRLIVYDAEPCHSGMRLGIMAEPPRPGKPLNFQPVSLPPGPIVWEDQQPAPE